MNAVHRGLLCVDVVESILEYLAPGPQISSLHLSSESGEELTMTSLPLDPVCMVYQGEMKVVIEERRLRQKTLARLARVCSALSDLALDVLWRIPDSLYHLLLVAAFRMELSIDRENMLAVSLILSNDLQ